MAKTAKYVPTQAAKLNPRDTRVNGVRVGIGGNVTKVYTAPKPTKVVPEATPEQYEILYNQGYTHLVQKVEE